MNEDERRRVDEALLCKDADYIPKVPDAGKVRMDGQGRRVQVMHNGLFVMADGYYGEFVTKIIERMRGHHEPQEEKVFYEVLKAIAPGSTMIELGCYWAYYSMWFQQAVKDARNFLIEPAKAALKCGRSNLQLNGMRGDFTLARIGRTSTPGWQTRADPTSKAEPPTVCVRDFVREKGIGKVTLLHSDIQGFEYEMLQGCGDLINGGQIEFVFISTHNLKVHFQCLKYLARARYSIIAEHTPKESYSDDGLIVAAASPSAVPRVPISKRPVSARLKLKTAAYKLLG
jgi:FkbM family methyltransferase